MIGTGGGRFLYDGVEIAGFGNVGSTTIGTRFVRGPWPDEIVAS